MNSDLERVRKVWIIHALLQCKPLRQKDFIELWNFMGEFQCLKKKVAYLELKEAIESEKDLNIIKISEKKLNLKLEDYKAWKYNKIDKGVVSRLLKGTKNKGGLKAEGIIEEFLVPSEGRGGVPYAYRLVKSHEALYKILVQLNNPNFSTYFIRDMEHDLCHSEYAKSVVNMDLVEIVDSRLHLSLLDEEKDLVLNILKISPSALRDTLWKINREDELFSVYKNRFYQSDRGKDAFMLELILELYNDVKNPFFDSLHMEESEFKLELSLKTKNGEYGYSGTIKRPLEELVKAFHSKLDHFNDDIRKIRNYTTIPEEYRKIIAQIEKEIEEDYFNTNENYFVDKKERLKLPMDRFHSPLTYKSPL